MLAQKPLSPFLLGYFSFRWPCLEAMGVCCTILQPLDALHEDLKGSQSNDIATVVPGLVLAFPVDTSAPLDRYSTYQAFPLDT